MGAFPITRRAYPVRNSGALPAFGETVTWRLRQQPRHLARVDFLTKITVTPGGADAVTCTQDKDSLDGVIARLKVNINDTTSGRRTAVDAQGSSLIAWSVRKGVALDRWTKRALKPPTGVSGAQTHWVKTPVHFMDPTLPDTVAPVTSVPLYDAGDRPKLNEEIEFKLTFGAQNLNLSAGTTGAAVADCVAVCYFLENVGPKIPYIPTSLLQTDWKFYAAGAAEPLDVEKDGYLASILFDGYDDAGLTTGGEPLATGGRVIIKQDNFDLDEFDTVQAVVADDEYEPGAVFTASAAGVPRSLAGPTFMRDFLHSQPGTNGNVPYSMPRVWADSSRVRLTADSVTQSTGFKVTVHKFLAADLNALAGV